MSSASHAFGPSITCLWPCQSYKKFVFFFIFYKHLTFTSASSWPLIPLPLPISQVNLFLCVSSSHHNLFWQKRTCSHSYFVTDRLTSLVEWPHSGSSANLSQSRFLSHLFLWNMHWKQLKKNTDSMLPCSTGNGCSPSFHAFCLIQQFFFFFAFYLISNFSDILEWFLQIFKCGDCLIFFLFLLLFLGSFAVVLFCVKTQSHSVAQANLKLKIYLCHQSARITGRNLCT